MKKLRKSLIVLVSLLSVSSLQASTITKVNLNGQKVFMSELPITKNGITYVDVNSIEKALGIEISSTVKSMPIREVASKVGATLKFDKTTNTININYEVNGQTDSWGRLIRVTNLPSNHKDFEYILSGVPNKMYELRFLYDTGSAKENGRIYLEPKNMKNDEWYSKDNIESWVRTVEQHLELILNVDYRTISYSWADKVAMTYIGAESKDTDSYKMYYQYAKEYVDYVKQNKIIIQGDYYVEPSMTYMDLGEVFIRSFVKFKITANTDKVELFESNASKLKTNTWHEGFVDLGLATFKSSSDGNDLKIHDDKISETRAMK